MTREQIDQIPRVEARTLMARIPAGPGYDDRCLVAVECAMNLEWWRGYHAAASEPDRVNTLTGLPALRQAIVEHTKGDLFWIGEILLSELEKETGFKG